MGDLTAELLDEWTLWMRAAGMSERTVDNRLSLVRFFGRYADVDACTAEWKSLATFLSRELASGQRVSPGTRQVNYADLDAWFSWLQAMSYRSDNPLDRLHKPKAVKRYPRPVTTSQLERVLATANRRRTLAMVLLGAYQGLRVHEIAKFRGEDIEGQFLHVLGKGSKPARLPLHPDVAAIALDFPRYGYWFPSYTLAGQPLTAKSVCTVISKLMDRAEVRATAHQLRHWYGTEVLRAAGGNLRIAQELLRHDSPSTTALYTFVDDAEARAAILGLPRVAGQAAIPDVVDVVRQLRIVA
ncbi:tyrosine-type recombinase/integrase [Blastococcus sp. CT_GayMR16]|uniref:tyrosine-type recombinase/integrase n=1 Tax=Blastococcus sp. CT_GayMR16 TaxID=2559607 RepID=UPI0014305AD9|nr:tyrosine-type recombinase/integrase [Blastococcus sp. CT_GayMR16]